MTVVSKRLDDTTLGHSPAMTAANHALELCCECLQATDTAFHLLKLAPCDPINGCAGAVRLVGQTQKLSDRVEREAECPTVANESQPFEMRPSEAPLVSPGARRTGHQADLLVVTDRLDFAACLDGQFANRQVSKVLFAHGVVLLNLQPLEGLCLQQPVGKHGTRVVR